MKRAAFVLLGLVAACASDGGEGVGEPVGESVDASNEVGTDDGDVVGADAGSTEAEAEAAPADPCADAGVPPSTLACTGLYADFASKRIAPNAFEYTPSTSLWSDGAQKQRWIMLPPNTQIDVSDPNEWNFPIGTKLFKEFRVEGQRVETRLFQKVDSHFWNYATYAWSRDGSTATIHYGGPVPVGDGGSWNIPTNDDCNQCHRGRQDRILGFEQVGLGLPYAQGLTLARLAELGLVTPAPSMVSLSIGDDGTGVDAIALAWIHVNCGTTCHNSNPAASGYGAAMNLRLDPAQLDGTRPNVTTWNILKTTVGAPCVSGSLIGQTRIVPGDSAGSVLYQLISQRGTLQMPPIATRVIDSANVAVVGEWIRSLAHDGGVPPADAEAQDAPGPPDGAPPDVSSPDAGVDDAGDDGATQPGDESAPDAGTDASEPDDAEGDASDAASPDEPQPDAESPETAEPEVGP